MTAPWDAQRFVEPISEDRPCGESLEDQVELTSLDAFQIFGQDTLEPEAKPPAQPGAREVKPVNREPRPSDRPPNWLAIQELSEAGLAKSRDFRLLAHLSAAVLRTEGVPAFCQTLSVASAWLSVYWPAAYPGVSEDAIARRSALNCFADRAAIIEGLRLAPLVSSREHGRITLRDCDLAAAPGGTGDAEAQAGDARINAAFGAMPLDELRRLQDAVSGATTSLKAMDTTMRERAGIEAALDFDPLLAQLTKVVRVVQAQVALRSDGGEPAIAGGAAGAAGAPVGVVRSRDEAVRALDAVADFFRKTEPSSPVPMFVERAKRLVSRNFLDILADVAPGGLSEAKSAGGVKDV